MKKAFDLHQYCPKINFDLTKINLKIEQDMESVMFDSLDQNIIKIFDNLVIQNQVP